MNLDLFMTMTPTDDHQAGLGIIEIVVQDIWKTSDGDL